MTSDSQSMVPKPAASASPGTVEMQITCPLPDLLNQNLYRVVKTLQGDSDAQ